MMLHKRHNAHLLLLSLLLILPGRLYAQDAAPAENVEESAPPPEAPASPPPGDEVMVPTKHGIRLTPKIADLFGRQLIKEELSDKLELDDSQRERMAEFCTRRANDLNARMAREGAEAIEHFYASIIRREVGGRKNISPEEAREFSQKVRPGVRIIDDFWDGLCDDARPMLSDEQYAKLKESADEIHKLTRKFDERMDRWSRGEVKENEGILDGIDDQDPPTDQPGKSKEYQQAERNVRWRVDMMGPTEWRMFLNRTGTICEFDPAQKKAGQQLLKEYQEKAKVIMTKEWKAKALRNQVQQQLSDSASQEPLEPWKYHLEMEYKELTKPLREMGHEFHQAVLAIATPEQRQKLVDPLVKIGTEHGMKPAELDGDVLLQEILKVQPAAATAPAQ